MCVLLESRDNYAEMFSQMRFTFSAVYKEQKFRKSTKMVFCLIVNGEATVMQNFYSKQFRNSSGGGFVE